MKELLDLEDSSKDEKQTVHEQWQFRKGWTGIERKQQQQNGILEF